MAFAKDERHDDMDRQVRCRKQCTLMQTTKRTRDNLPVDVVTPTAVSVAVCAAGLVTVVTVVSISLLKLGTTQPASSASEHAPMDVAVIAEGDNVARLAQD